MATSSDAVRAQLTTVTAAAAAEIAAEAAQAAPERRLAVALGVLPQIVPAYYDAAGSLAALWYDELRAEVRPSTSYVPTIVGDPVTDWIDREVRKAQTGVEADFEAELARLMDEVADLAEKEVARGFRDTITGNTNMDREAIGWSRIARPGACKFCTMLADKGAIFRSESTAIFSAHKRCHCAARPAFKGGEHGPEANVIQYEASSNRPRTQEALEARNKRLREYLNENYPDLPG